MTTLSGQNMLSTSGKAIVNESGDTILLRGMGLGGWMLQEGYMLQTAGFANAQYQIREKIEELIGEEDTDLFYEAWLQNHVRKIDIDSLKAWGFNSVRLPMHYNLFTLPIQEEPVAGENTWLTKGFEMTDSLISWCAQNEMYVILDLHAAPGGQGYDQGISDYNPDLPSLWQSQANQDKTVALWRNLAERYADEQWVAGYDLLNETNWDMTNNAPLRALYNDIIDNIREVDNNHIVFIEGNWFANDFTGLTPPWDEKMVYAPHKYWSFNNTESIQWVLDLREQYNVPLYFGESGENSNTWFRDAIKLMEDEGIGWAWWPMKKIESISGPLSIEKTPEYQVLLNYWNNGGNPPDPGFAKATLMELTENLKLENCYYQKDVVDAMIRQVQSDEAIPYNTQPIPGVVYATDFDMGKVGVAYFDTDLANYHVSSGNYTAWNKGWAYRNDGIDIEKCTDNVNTNGFNVGWNEPGEWMQYDIEVSENAVYDIHLRLASGGFDGQFQFSADGGDITNNRYVPHTGGYQNWQTVIVPDVILTTGDSKLRFHSKGRDYNVSSFEFIATGSLNSLETAFVSAYTIDENTVQLNLNKPLNSPIPQIPEEFQIFVNTIEASISTITQDSENPRILLLEVDFEFEHGQTIRMNYNGNQITAIDETVLSAFFQKEVENRIPVIHQIPGKIEAEDFAFQVGIELENTYDVGGGKNVGFLDVGDYLDYNIDVIQAGIYTVDYRTASLDGFGGIKLQLIDESGGATLLQTVNFEPTGDWQSWATTSSTALLLPEGRHKLRVEIFQPSFNLNWIQFNQITSSENVENVEHFSVFPNPGRGLFKINLKLKKSQTITVDIVNQLGQQVFHKTAETASDFYEQIDLQQFPDGQYFLTIRTSNGGLMSRKIIKLDD